VGEEVRVRMWGQEERISVRMGEGGEDKSENGSRRRR
jgi:hypothetical protein